MRGEHVQHLRSLNQPVANEGKWWDKEPMALCSAIVSGTHWGNWAKNQGGTIVATTSRYDTRIEISKVKDCH